MHHLPPPTSRELGRRRRSNRVEHGGKLGVDLARTAVEELEREQFRLFCVLENAGDEELLTRELPKPSIAVITEMRKPCPSGQSSPRPTTAACAGLVTNTRRASQVESRADDRGLPQLSTGLPRRRLHADGYGWTTRRLIARQYCRLWPSSRRVE